MACVLAIDTSGPFASVAMKLHDNATISEVFDDQVSHFEGLEEIVRIVFEKASIELDAIDLIILGGGPGSFTGLRIGSGFVKGLSWSQKIPVVQISSFFGIASHLSDFKGGVVVVGDARRRELFTQFFKGGKPISEIAISEPEDLFVHSVTTFAEDGAKFEFVSTDNSSLRFGGSLVKNVALGLLNHAPRIYPAYDLAKLSALEPTYVRAVAAKTILERGS